MIDPNQMSTVEIEREKKRLTQELTGLAKRHKELDMQLTREVSTMSLQEVQQFKKRINTQRLEMNRKSKELDKFGVGWDPENARRMVS